jgi:acetyl esterase
MLHPQAQALLDLIQQRGVPPTHTLTPADARTLYRERRSFTQPDSPPIGACQDLLAEGPLGKIPLRLYRPVGSHENAALPVLVYFHGGGWVIGDLDTHDTLCRQLSNGAGVEVISVEYRMGPEHKFPAAVDDCITATRWVHAHAAELHIDPARIAVGGDSAGGNLAAVVAIAARDAGDLPLAYQLLIYPATDQHRGLPSHTTNGQGYMLTSDSLSYFAGHYFADKTQYDDWRASPLLRDDLSRLPPALVLTAGYDPLRDEGAAYAERLTAAGGQATYVCFEREIHGFILMGKVLDEANTAVALCAAELKRVLAA